MRVEPPVIRARGLTKYYGRDRGVVDLDFDVEAGEIFGFLGPNGAGKTTTIRLLLDLIRPTRGSVEVLGVDPRRDVSVRRWIGYLPGDLRLYERQTARDLLTYFARLRDLRGLGDAPALAERLGLELDRPIRALSKGNKQKVGLVQALMHEPALLVLDEPTAGLDPLIQQIVYELLGEVRERGTTVLSSHVLPEVEDIADRVGLVRDGRLLLVERVETLRHRAPARIEVTFATRPPAGAFAELPGVRVLDRDGRRMRFALEGEVDPLLKALARQRVVGLVSHEADLEDVFLSLYRGEPERHAA